MSKHIFVGDIHGKVEYVKEALARQGMKHFVGDLNDSYDRSTADHQRCYELVIAAVRKGEADITYGNHELSYLRAGHECSGFETTRMHMIRGMRKEIEETFRPYVLVKPNLLVTHAGLTRQLWDENRLTLETLGPWLDDRWKETPSRHHNPIDFIGTSRGGDAPYGGIFWCHYPDDFKPVANLRQVFGHTRRRMIDQRFPGNWAIDCLDFNPEIPFLELDL